MTFPRKRPFFLRRNWANDRGLHITDDTITKWLLAAVATSIMFFVYLAGHNSDFLGFNLTLRQLMFVCIFSVVSVEFHNWMWIKRAIILQDLDMLKPPYTRFFVSKISDIDTTGSSLPPVASALWGIQIVGLIWVSGKVGFPVQLGDRAPIIATSWNILSDTLFWIAFFMYLIAIVRFGLLIRRVDKKSSN